MRRFTDWVQSIQWAMVWVALVLASLVRGIRRLNGGRTGQQA